MILEVLKQAEEGKLNPVKQDESKQTYAKMLSKATGEVDFSKTAVEIERLIRGLNPWPSAFTHIHGKMLKIWEADVLDDEEVKAFDITKTDCGNIAYVDKNRMLISTGKGYLDVKELQLEGKKRMNIAAFLRGYKVEKGETLNG